MYISFKAWFDTCNKMSVSVKWYRCLDLAIYTDLFSLKSAVSLRARTDLFNQFFTKGLTASVSKSDKMD